MHWIWSIAALLTANVFILTRKPKTAPSIYLSFDDGPHPEHTPALLDLLKQHGARATFFVIGKRAQEHPEIMQRILAEGHAIGNHSMTHPRLPRLSSRAQIEEIRQADSVLARFNGKVRQLFRPPNGRATFTTIAHSLWHRQPIVLWSIDSLDYKLAPDDVVTRFARTKVGPGDIVLFHDDGSTAGNALQRLLPQWRACGLRFDPL